MPRTPSVRQYLTLWVLVYIGSFGNSCAKNIVLYNLCKSNIWVWNSHSVLGPTVLSPLNWYCHNVLMFWSVSRRKYTPAFVYLVHFCIMYPLFKEGLVASGFIFFLMTFGVLFHTDPQHLNPAFYLVHLIWFTTSMCSNVAKRKECPLLTLRIEYISPSNKKAVLMYPGSSNTSLKLLTILHYFLACSMLSK